MQKHSEKIARDEYVLTNSCCEKIYNTNELANLLKVSTRTVQRWRDYGIIKFSAVGSKFYYFHTDVVGMLNSNSIN
ncbi:helix-turn-helix domain-containing protein [Aquirufa sp.]|jgi:phage terminase Nu1 subunit (DNA packaging protein)|uniref:helix-turn-helix domain-containing protein n=1 Tax=Aquirufa sp. TaxID=2676249 RepID=UPI003784EC54